MWRPSTRTENSLATVTVYGGDSVGSNSGKDALSVAANAGATVTLAGGDGEDTLQVGRLSNVRAKSDLNVHSLGGF